MSLTRKQAERVLADMRTDRNDFRHFVEWAVERAEEEAPHAQGMVRSFLETLARDGRALLGEDTP